jgi:hypothetical protein
LCSQGGTDTKCTTDAQCKDLFFVPETAVEALCPKANLAIEVYKEADAAKLGDFKKSGRATTELYKKGRSNYDFSKNRPNDAASPTNVESFTNIVWRKNLEVAFAFKDDVAVLAYCILPASNTSKRISDATCQKCTTYDSAGVAVTACGDDGCAKGSACETTDIGYCENVKRVGCFKRVTAQMEDMTHASMMNN